MAIATLTPHSAPTDLMPLQEIQDLLRETGHPVSVSTIRRWATAGDFHTERRRSRQGRRDYVSFSDVLMAHREWVAGRA